MTAKPTGTTPPPTSHPRLLWVLLSGPAHWVGEGAAFWSHGGWVLLFIPPRVVPLFPEVLAFLPSCFCFPWGQCPSCLLLWASPHLEALGSRLLGCCVVPRGHGEHMNQRFTSSGTLTHTFGCLFLSFLFLVDFLMPPR